MVQAHLGVWRRWRIFYLRGQRRRASGPWHSHQDLPEGASGCCVAAMHIHVCLTQRVPVVTYDLMTLLISVFDNLLHQCGLTCRLRDSLSDSLNGMLPITRSVSLRIDLICAGGGSGVCAGGQTAGSGQPVLRIHQLPHLPADHQGGAPAARLHSPLFKPPRLLRLAACTV